MSLRRAPRVASLLVLGLASAGCARHAPPASQAAPAGQVDDARLVAAEGNAEWLSHGRSYSGQRFSPLDAINRANVAALGLAWYPEFDAASDRGMEATPLAVDGVLYVPASGSRVHAFDARTGRLLWSHDPGIDGQQVGDPCCDVVNRGVAVWEGRVYVAALDGRLIALDAATGREVWSQQVTDPALPGGAASAARPPPSSAKKGALVCCILWTVLGSVVPVRRNPQMRQCFLRPWLFCGSVHSPPWRPPLE